VLGYERIEILEKRSYYDPYRDHPDALEVELRKAGMTMVAMVVAADLYQNATVEEEIDHCLKTAASVATMDGECLLIVPGKRDFEGNQLGLTDDEYARLAEGLNHIGGECKAMGVTCCYTSHVRQVIERRHEINRVLAMTDSALVRLCYDPSHIYLGGWDPIACLEQHRDRIAYVHLRNFKNGAYSNPEAGEIDTQAILKNLEHHGYSGWILPCMPAYAHDGKSEADVARENLAFLQTRLW